MQALLTVSLCNNQSDKLPPWLVGQSVGWFVVRIDVSGICISCYQHLYDFFISLKVYEWRECQRGGDKKQKWEREREGVR